MSEPIEWLPDGTPYSPRFGDRYHSENGGLEQARRVFLHGCGMPAAWVGLPEWRILETGFGFGLNFLVTWAAWRADMQRPALLHFISTEAWPVSAADLLRAAPQEPELFMLAQQLHAQWWGLLPGVHRLQFEEGRVLLTLYIGDTQAMLRQQALSVDAAYLDGFSPQCNPDHWSLHTLKAVARSCRRGARLATWSVARTVRDALTQCGFLVERVPGVAPKRENLRALFNPHWEPRNATPYRPATIPGHCIVLGGGLAGAAIASSLAQRGWHVQVLDQAAKPATGASGLPAGLFAPHVSPDDSVLSRLSRSGVRATLWHASSLLREGIDWGFSGVMERRLDGPLDLPHEWKNTADSDWSMRATKTMLAQAGYCESTCAYWHERAGWLRPAHLVSALLAQPNISWRGSATVAQLRLIFISAQNQPDMPMWQALDLQGQVLAQAPMIVIAAGAGSISLLEHRWPLQSVRGSVSWGIRTHAPPLAPFPINGHGNFIPRFTTGDSATDEGWGWVMGSTFERDANDSSMALHTPPNTNTPTVLWDKLRTLVPKAADQLRHEFSSAIGGQSQTNKAGVRIWTAMRCTSPDHLPVVGPVDHSALPGLWVCTAMGSRGLTLALLCAQLLAARLHGEPLPVDAKLAKALSTDRLSTKSAD